MFLIPPILALVAQFAPALLSAFAGPKAADVGSQVIAIAQSITGASNQAEAAAALSAKPELMVQLQVQLAALALETAKVEASERAGQVALNAAQAGSASVFIAGARPFFMWVCGVGTAYAIFQGLIQAIFQLWHPGVILPPVNLAEYWPAFAGVLGISYNRTQEKLAGADTKRLAGRV